jgi:DNA replication protein DnaC
MDEIMGRLDKLRNFVVAFRGRLREWAKDQPQTKRCDRHQHDRPIDWERLCRESVSEREFKLVYAVCPACNTQEELLAESGWLHDRGVPLALCHAKFCNFKPRDESDGRALDAAERFSRRKAETFVISGHVGTGKSHLAVAIMRAKRCGLFIAHSTLLEGIRKTYRDKTAPDPVEVCKSAKFLVLDDLGVSGGGADDQPALHSILNHRHGEKLPTVITTNLTMEEMGEEIGSRMLDRIRESLFKWVKLVGQSRRGEVPYVD